MNESINMGPSPEEEAEADFLRDYLERHPTPVVVSLESSPTFESLVSDFEAKHSLEELLEIGILSPELAGMFSKDRGNTEEVIDWLARPYHLKMLEGIGQDLQPNKISNLFLKP